VRNEKKREGELSGGSVFVLLLDSFSPSVFTQEIIENSDRPACVAAIPSLTFISGREYHFFVKGGLDSELKGSVSRAERKSKFL